MLEALGEWMGFPAYFAGYGGSKPKRSGASHAAIVPYGPFECKDKEIVFLGIQNEREWGSFCERAPTGRTCTERSKQSSDLSFEEAI